MNYNHLICLQPNKAPFLFLEDLIEIIPEKLAINKLSLPMRNWYFDCHWESDPNMPAMLQLEAMSQTASMCLFSKKDPPKKLYLVSIKNASFRKKITPGMEIIIKAILEEKINNVYKFKVVIRSNKDILISKSRLDLLWP